VAAAASLAAAVSPAVEDERAVQTARRRKPARTCPCGRAKSFVSLVAVGWTLVRAAAANGEPVRLFAEGAYWRSYPSGTMTITEGGRSGSGTRIDLSDDLDLGAANVGEGRIGGEIASHRLSLGYEPLSVTGEATLGRSVVFHGVEFPAAERVQSEIDLRSIVPRYDYMLLDSPTARLRAGLGAYVWTFEAKMRGSSGDTSRSFTHVLPLVPLESEVPFGPWSVAATASFGTSRYGPLRGRGRSRAVTPDHVLVPCRRRLPLAGFRIPRDDEPRARRDARSVRLGPIRYRWRTGPRRCLRRDFAG
jgi:hypothetical protein